MNIELAGDYFQWWIDTCLMRLERLQQQDGARGINSKINYGILGHVNKEHVLQFKCSKVTCFKIVWTTMELYGTEEYDIKGLDHTNIM